MDSLHEHEVERTGTLPVSGSGAMPVTPEARSEDARDLVDHARESVTVPGRYLVYEEFGERLVASVSREWTRIGRSLSADVRFDDATVSRRHALVANQADGVRILDDRSLNGVIVNGRRVEWSPLRDGDRIQIGRHLLVFVDTATVGQATVPEPALAGG
jgi:pSer/pThr/pTyr-binding forkhead associated (FHA) protein